jgi:two-component system, OmpR family, response regulator CpxR
MAQPWYILGVHILLVDDDAELCSLLSQFLTREGFSVEYENEGSRGLEKAGQPGVNLVVLDVMLPGLDGFEILRRLRQHSKVPVIMLTARGEDVDRIVGLELGADDYLPKPFNPRELAARIRAILRRYEAQPAPAGSPRLEVNGVALDPGSREVFADGHRIDLTTFEFDILEMLMRNAGRVLSRDALMENFYNRKATPFDRSIDMHISHLRKKLEHGDTIIKTIRGVGYQFCRTPEDAGAE